MRVAQGTDSDMKTVVMLAYDGVESLDLLGPLEIFARANGAGFYRTLIAAPGGVPFTTESGVTMVPHRALDADLDADTVFVPGGVGLRDTETQATVATWLRANEHRFRRVASVCTGLYGLAASGLVDGKHVTTHWRFSDSLRRAFPALRFEDDRIFCRDGKYYTSAGILAGVDLALAMVEDDCGPAVAHAVARDLVVYVRRPGSQAQFSEPLQMQARTSDRFADLTAWMTTHLRADLSVETLASRVALSPRQFSRRFQQTFGRTPASYVEQLRLDAARQLLASTKTSIERVADTVGFQSADTFRRAFERNFGVTPAFYRAQYDGISAMT